MIYYKCKEDIQINFLGDSTIRVRSVRERVVKVFPLQSLVGGAM
ncbi:hypothetical protein [Neobacillus niacini]|nr:hypothetical protein [Neobacillus niacini]